MMICIVLALKMYLYSLISQFVTIKIHQIYAKAQSMAIHLVRLAMSSTWSSTVRNLVDFAQVGHFIAQ